MGHPPTRPGGIGKDEKRNTTKRQTVKMKEDQKPHPLLNCAKDWAPTHPRPYLTLGVGHPSTHRPTSRQGWAARPKTKEGRPKAPPFAELRKGWGTHAPTALPHVRGGPPVEDPENQQRPQQRVRPAQEKTNSRRGENQRTMYGNARHAIGGKAFCGRKGCAE